MESQYIYSLQYTIVHIQFTLFQTKNLQSPGTYISNCTWDLSQEAITK